MLSVKGSPQNSVNLIVFIKLGANNPFCFNKPAVEGTDNQPVIPCSSTNLVDNKLDLSGTLNNAAPFNQVVKMSWTERSNVRSTSSIKMYYRVTGAEDVRLLGDVAWRAFNDDGSPDSAVSPAVDDVTFREHKFSVSGLPAFTAFALKVVMTGTVSSYPPIIKDMRGIALAV